MKFPLIKNPAAPRVKLERDAILKRLNRSTPRTLSSPIVQFKAATISTPDYAVTLDSPVGAGNILVAFAQIAVFGQPFAPVDNVENAWVQAPQPETYPDWPTCWYALHSKPGTTTISFAGGVTDELGFDRNVLVIEINGPWNAFDNFNAVQNDPPFEVTIDVVTSQPNALVIAYFAGPNISGGDDSGISPGEESFQIATGVGPYAVDDPWSYFAEYQVAAEVGDATATAFFDNDIVEDGFQMAIAFKFVEPVPGQFRIGPLSMSNFVPYSI